MKTVNKILPLLALVLVTLYSHGSYASETTSDSGELQIHQCRSKTPKGTILFVHGGPWNKPKQDVFELIKGFIDDLTESYNFVAPEICAKHSNEQTKQYIEDIHKAYTYILENFPNTDIYMISHSLGAHWGGQYLLDKKKNKTIKKWVILSGTTHHGAAGLKRYIEDLSEYWDAVKQYQENNLTTLQKTDDDKISLGHPTTKTIVQNLGRHVKWREVTVKIALDQRYKITGVSASHNPIMDYELNRKMSVGLNVDRLPNIPVLIIHPIDDWNETVDIGLALYKELSQKERDVRFVTRESGGHSWHKDIRKESHPDSYSQLFGSLSLFLSGAVSQIEDSSPSLKLVEDYLSKNPSFNYAKLYDKFHKGSDIEISPHKNQNHFIHNGCYTPDWYPNKITVNHANLMKAMKGLDQLEILFKDIITSKVTAQDIGKRQKEFFSELAELRKKDKKMTPLLVGEMWYYQLMMQWFKTEK